MSYNIHSDLSGAPTYIREALERARAQLNAAPTPATNPPTEAVKPVKVDVVTEHKVTKPRKPYTKKINKATPPPDISTINIIE